MNNMSSDWFCISINKCCSFIKCNNTMLYSLVNLKKEQLILGVSVFVDGTCIFPSFAVLFLTSQNPDEWGGICINTV